jgi:superfamily II DNA or RNA helicase
LKEIELTIERRKAKINTTDLELFESLRTRYSIRNKSKRYCRFAKEHLCAITPTGLFNYGLTRDIMRTLKEIDPYVKITLSDNLRKLVHPFSYPIGNIIEVPNKDFPYRDYQINAIQACLMNGRGLIVSPTGSGKSLILMGIVNNICIHNPSIRNILLLVPSIQLVKQMYSDFLEYGMKPEMMQMFSAFKPELGKEPIVIANRQYLEGHGNELPKIDMVLVDETHQLNKNNAVSDFVDKLETPIRFGLTGTLPNELIDIWNAKGVVGPVIFEEKITNLQERKLLVDVSILPIRLDHHDIPPEIYEPIVYINDRGQQITDLSKMYHNEWKYVEEKESANDAIVKMIGKLRGNSLVLFSHTEHGNILFDKLDMRNKQFIDGSIDVDVREDIRDLMEKNDDCCLVGQVGCCSTGINIKNISNIVFINMCKSIVRVVQSIGRGLRPRDGKDKVNILDIYHNMRYSQKHFGHRKTIYKKHYNKKVESIYTVNV